MSDYIINFNIISVKNKDYIIIKIEIDIKNLNYPKNN